MNSNTRTPRGVLLAATVAAGVVLGGCVPDGDGIDDRSGKPVSTGATQDGAPSGVACDPDGFGPLAGCGEGPSRDELTGILDSAPLDAADPPSACPPEYGAVIREDGAIDFASEGTVNVKPGSACQAQIEQDSREFTGRFLGAVERELENPTPRDWTVQDTHPLDGGCLVGMNEVGTEHFSRRPMPGHCDQYPVGSEQHTGGAR